MSDATLMDEAGRLSALRRYNVLDSGREEPFEKITTLVRTILQVPMAAVSLIDQDRQWFKSHQGIGPCQSSRQISFCDHTIRTRSPLMIPDALLDARFATNPLVLGEPHIRSYAGVPLSTHDGYNVGALCALDHAPREFTDAEIAILSNFAGLVLSELELRQIAQRDQLTGALTRRGLLAQAEKEIARRDRHDRPSALVLLDVDHFKAVNDTHGHPAGDKVLQAISETCVLTMRPNDVFGRVGGEEFVLLLPDTDAADAVLATERFRRVIQDLAIDIGGTEPLRVTASFGIAPLSPDIQSGEQWLAKADRPLYAAKHSGRNRACISASEERVSAFARSDANPTSGKRRSHRRVGQA